MISNLIEGEFLAVETLPRPESIDSLVITKRGIFDYEEIKNFVDFENFGRDYSHVTACQVKNGEIIRLDECGWKFAEPEIHNCFCGASLTQSELDEGYCPQCHRDV